MFLSNRTLQLQPNSGIWEKWASPQIGSTRMKKTGGCVFYVFFSRFFHGSFNWLNLPTPLCFTVFCLKTVLTRDQQSSCRTSDFVVLYGSGYSWVLFKPQRCKGWWCFGVKTHDGLVGLVEISEKPRKNQFWVVVSLWMSPQFFRQKYLKDWIFCKWIYYIDHWKLKRDWLENPPVEDLFPIEQLRFSS